jgi:hypothetical protein
MADLIGKGFDAMRQLKLDCDQIWQAAHDAGLNEASPDFPRPTKGYEEFETAAGLTITKTGDFLDLSAEFEETDNGKSYDSLYVVEFPEDLRNWPSVFKTTFVPRIKVETVTRKKFYDVAGLLSGLIVPRELVS